MNSKVIKLHVFIVCIFLSLNLSANLNFDNVKVLSVIDGLSNNCVLKTVQDHFGQIWIATEWGLNCYNGTDIRKYLYNPEDSCSLSNNFVQVLYADKKSKELWVGTNNGLNLYSFNSDNFRRLNCMDKKYDVCFNDVIDIAPQDDGKIWICSFYGGLLSYDKRSNAFSWIKSTFDITHKDERGIKALTMFDDNYGSLWIGTDGNGIIRYNKKDKKTILYSLSAGETGEILHGSIRDFYLEVDNILWVSTSIGLFYYDLKSDTKNFKEATLLKKTSTYAMSMAGNNEVWIAGEKGIYSISKNDFKPDSETMPSFNLSFSSARTDVTLQSIRDIFQDENMNLWLSSYTGGAILIPGVPSIFKSLLINLKGEVVRNYKPLCISEDLNSNLYIGTDGNGIYYQNAQDETWRHLFFKDDNHSQSINIIQTLYLSDNDILWAGTYDCGLIFYNKKSGAFINYNSRNSDLTGDDVRVIKQYNNEIWVGAKNGLTLFEASGELVKTYPSGKNGLDGHDIREIGVLNDGNLWLVLYNGGLVYFDRKNETFTVYKNNPKDKTSLPSNMISDICCKKGLLPLVVTRDDGICVFEGNGGFRVLDKIKTSYPIIKLFEDSEQNFWFSTMNGVHRFNQKAEKNEDYRDDNISGIGTFYGSIGLFSKNGNIYFGGSNGIIYFNPKSVSESISPVYRPIFSDFQLFNKSVKISTEDEPTSLKSNILTMPDIHLSHNQSVFSIHYAVTDYVNRNVEYAYVLEGESNEWSYVGERTFAEYRNLSPGVYTFKVKASGRDGVWSDNYSQLRIIVEPPFWRTPSMYVLYILFTLLVIFTLISFYIRRINKKNKIKLEQMKRERAEDLYKSKLQFFTNISHEFRTPLTLISEPVIRLLKDEQDKDRLYLLSLIKRNSDRLLQLINQILDLRKIDRGGFRLKLRNSDLIEVIEGVMSSYHELSIRKNISCSLKKCADEYKFYFDEELLIKSISNILSNAFKFTPNYGEIIVSIEEKAVNGKEVVAISVADTGIGISKDIIDKIFDRFYQSSGEPNTNASGSGIGLHLVKELVELHQGSISVESAVGEGSVFAILLPLDCNLYTKEAFDDSEAKSYLINQNEVYIQVDPQEDTFPDDSNKKEYTILVVDDDPDIRTYLKHCLISKFNIMVAEDGEQAWSIIQENSIDVVVSDLMMPKIDGIKLCSFIKNDIASCHIPVILLTVKTTISSQIEGFDSGADGYVPKPFDMGLLDSVIHSVIRRTNLLKKKYSQYISNDRDQVNEESFEELFLQIPAQTDAFIMRAIEIVESEMGNTNFNGEMLAEKLMISRVHLHRKLKSILNISTSEFIRNIRLRKAAGLLLEGDKNISEVCYDTGFNSPAYFSTSFTKFFGISPRDYLAKHLHGRS